MQGNAENARKCSSPLAQGHSTLVRHMFEADAAAALLFLPRRSLGLSAVAASPWAAAAGAACCRAPPRGRGPPRAWRARCPT